MHIIYTYVVYIMYYVHIVYTDIMYILYIYISHIYKSNQQNNNGKARENYFF